MCCQISSPSGSALDNDWRSISDITLLQLDLWTVLRCRRSFVIIRGRNSSVLLNRCTGVKTAWKQRKVPTDVPTTEQTANTCTRLTTFQYFQMRDKKDKHESIKWKFNHFFQKSQWRGRQNFAAAQVWWVRSNKGLDDICCTQAGYISVLSICLLLPMNL